MGCTAGNGGCKYGSNKEKKGIALKERKEIKGGKKSRMAQDSHSFFMDISQPHYKEARGKGEETEGEIQEATILGRGPIIWLKILSNHESNSVKEQDGEENLDRSLFVLKQTSWKGGRRKESTKKGREKNGQ